jgi:uncharacterized protein (DUF2141 family)
MKTQLSMFLFLMAAMIVMISASNITQQKFDKITVNQFELVDKSGQQRVSIRAEEDGEVVLD